ncbi:MAG: Rpn family recombination-promoting nuclease/putative transposase [Lachnospiraceae bacterium]|nr:Rpn family recombination-promoting nuclease/putative transposase [Lachnospiraceae bacterium]
MKEKLTPDVVLKNYWDGDDEFTDFFNAVLFDGDCVIHSLNDTERDTAAAVVLENKEKTSSFENFRDNIKIQLLSADSGAKPALFCLESQSYINYSMPVKVMGYNYGTYDKQLRKNSERYTGTDSLKGNEYLSSMRKEDRFMPVVTIVLYYNKEAWDGPSNLKDILDIPSPLKGYVSDHPFLLIEARDCELKLHNTNNIHFFRMLQIALNSKLSSREGKAKLKQYADEHRPSKKVLITLAGVLGTAIDYNKYEREDITMETIFDDMFMEWEAKGEARGEVKGAKGLIETCQELGCSDQYIIEKLQTKLNLARSKAVEFMEKYGKQPA